MPKRHNLQPELVRLVGIDAIARPVERVGGDEVGLGSLAPTDVANARCDSSSNELAAIASVSAVASSLESSVS